MSRSDPPRPELWLAMACATALCGVRPVEARILRVPEDFATIQGAVDAAEFGDSVFIGAGRYRESVRIDTRSRLTIRGSGSASTHVVGPFSNAVFRVLYSSDVEISHLSLSNEDFAGDGGSGGIWLDDCSGVRLHHLFIFRAAANGITVLGSEVYIHDNVIHDVGDDGISFRNVIEFGPSSGVVHHNTIVGNNGDVGVGIFVESRVEPPIVVFDNVIWNNDYGIATRPFTIGEVVVHDHNLVGASWVDDYFGAGISRAPGEPDCDPGFVDAAAGDFRLLPGSCAREIGVRDYLGWPASLVDLDGRPRPQGAEHDLGALEACDAPFPDGIWDTLRVSRGGDAVVLDWSRARAMLVGEHPHVFKALDAPHRFERANGEGAVLQTFSDVDASSSLQFFDVRIANACEEVSRAEYPPSHDLP